MAVDSPTVSVLMPVVNPLADYLRQSVQSVLRQSLYDLELLIIEDPSEVGARHILKDLADPRLRLHRNPERSSLVEQRNLGLRLAGGTLIACLDYDDIAERDRLARQVEYLQANPAVAVLGSQLQVIDAAGTTIGYRCYPLEHREILAALHIRNPIAQPAVMFRAEAVREVKGYQATPSGLNEDYDLWCRLAEAGHRFATHPDALTRYRIHPGGLKSTRLRAMLRDTIYIKQRYWRAELGFRGWARLALERLLLAAPASVVTRLFLATQTQDGPCRS